MIVGHGIDIVEVKRVRMMLRKFGKRFLDKIFTPEEQKYCHSKANPSLHFASRFAAKEACLKALQTGFSQGMYFKDISVVTKASGAPLLKLTGQVLKRAKKMGAKHFFVSLSDESSLAMASVILTK
ncbi:MAG: holo-ACP synthase [Deltaproteobacteria bacterium]|nr:holo-ACP synthase [Deltaproteobacteria bacterium]